MFNSNIPDYTSSKKESEVLYSVGLARDGRTSVIIPHPYGQVALLLEPEGVEVLIRQLQATLPLENHGN